MRRLVHRRARPAGTRQRPHTETSRLQNRKNRLALGGSALDHRIILCVMLVSNGVEERGLASFALPHFHSHRLAAASLSAAALVPQMCGCRQPQGQSERNWMPEDEDPAKYPWWERPSGMLLIGLILILAQQVLDRI